MSIDVFSSQIRDFQNPRRPRAWLAVIAVLGAVIGSASLRADFVYSDFSSLVGLTLNGDAAGTDDVLRVAPAAQGQAGSAWYTASKAHVADGFDTVFQFQMHGGDGADGLAFVIQDSSATALGVGGSDMGYGGIPRSLAVELDTFGFFPETDNHVSIQTNGAGPNSHEDAFSIGMANFPFPDLNDGQTHTFTVRYRPGVMVVYLDSNIPLMHIEVDLQDLNGDNILDGSGDAWVGFTAGTGLFNQNHDVLNWNFDENSGPLPTGACCQSTGCVLLNAVECDDAGGSYAGDNVTCSSGNCQGACCTNIGCLGTSFQSCVQTFGGQFAGVGIECESGACLGACCDGFGTCFPSDEFSCEIDGVSTFMGIQTPCEPFPCGLPAYAACCVGPECLTQTEAGCADSGGVWRGYGSNCGETDCGVPPTLSACCQPGGICRETDTQAHCEQFNGEYQGDGVGCEEVNCGGAVAGACCLLDGNCAEVLEQACQEQGGHFQGADSSCSNPNLNCGELGVCCKTDGSCATTSVDYCFNDLGGSLFSTPGTCEDAVCTYGACCLPDGNCQEDWVFNCDFFDGEFQGQSSLCAFVSCLEDCDCLGDTSDDGNPNGGDVQSFVDCYLGSFGGPPIPGCQCVDTLQDGTVDEFDIGEFVTILLTSDGCPS
ncbi:MAG TPA: L-type lectin-domain containing protein [Phycisphaerae bacterium]|nr:L-type lectin-domain containing protein [Phycisphaerae bacterium]